MAMIRQSTSIAFLLLAGLAAARPAAASDPRMGRVIGWVEDSRGVPVAGALVSVFAKGMRDGGFVTFSDETGRFLLMSLPPGSYTMRAARSGHAPAAARQITVLPNQDSILSVSLAAIGGLTRDEIEARTSELKWLERHKRRSVLEERDPLPVDAASESAPAALDLLAQVSPWLSGSFEVMADSSALGSPADSTVGQPGTGSGVLRLNGKIADGASFSLGGLVAESQTVTWRMATELSVDAGSGHDVQVGAGYGTQFARLPGDAPADNAGIGTVFIGDHWQAGRLAIAVGARHSYIGFVPDRNHTDPSASVEFEAGKGMTLRGSLKTHTLAPGGDLLSLSTLNVTPVITDAVTDGDLRPERIVRYELAVERRLGPAHVEGRFFHEGARDQLINAFSEGETGRMLHVFNGRGLSSRGGGIEVSRTFGNALSGSFAYTYGHSWRDAPLSPLEEGGDLAAFDHASFHDLVARVETFCGWTDTRVVAFYRINTLHPAGASLAPYDARQGGGAIKNTRFDVQLSQGLPFLGSVTRADWDLLFAVRNLFYDGSDEGTLDEIAVVNPPNRVLGGISVRF